MVESPQQEFWMPVCGYEGLYAVSDQGRVKSLARDVYFDNPRTGGHTGKIKTKTLKTNPGLHGYPRVNLFKDKQHKMYLVHRLVAKAFLLGEKKEVNHKDGNKLNSHLYNLEWTTPQENSLHSCRVLKRGPAAKGRKYETSD